MADGTRGTGPRDARGAAPAARRTTTRRPAGEPARGEPRRPASGQRPPAKQPTRTPAKAPAKQPVKQAGRPLRSAVEAPPRPRPQARTTTQGRPAQGRQAQDRTAQRRTVQGRPPQGRPSAPRTRPPRPPRPPRRRPRLGNPDLRLRLVLVVVFLVMSVLGGRLVQLQGLDSASVAEQALKNRMRTVDLPAHRGDITDINGERLAWTVERRHILVDQTLVRNYVGAGSAEKPEGVPGAARALAPILDMDVPTLTKKLSGKARGAYLKKDVTPEVYREVYQKVRALRIPGIAAEQASRRVYPAQTVGSQIVGFVSKDGRALAGVERIFDPELKGTDGRWTFERSGDGSGAQIPTGVNEEVEPVDGNGVRLTIDQDIQWQAQQILEAQVKATEAETGYVVVMTKTGQILALASAPGFDASDPGASDAADRQNRALTDVFEPGSTSKVVTLAAALEEGVAKPTDEITVEGTLRRSDRIFHDAEAHGTEKLTVAGVLAKSSNIGTIKIGEQVPAETMYDYMRKFGLGAKTGIFGTSRSSATLAESSGILAPPSKWSGSQRYTMMFGQGLAVTALQSADVFATIANDGVRVAPRVVAGTTSPDGVYTAAPAAPQTRVVSAQTARDVRLMLENVVGEEGTARRAEIPGYRVAGKTGTSQYADPTCGCYRSGLYTSSFIGMAPADKPEIVVAVVLQKPKNGYFGGTVAAPVFQQVMSYALTKRQVPPTLTKKPDLPLTWK